VQNVTLRLLEAFLAVARATRTVQLTSAGQVFVGRASQILAEFSSAIEPLVGSSLP
jgi:DNA-binding transcriptional LysR family regulator